MSHSTKLLTATYILSYVAANAPETVTTERIAEQVAEHPARVRQIVAALVKAGLLAATRGAAGGVSLKKPAAAITLQDVRRAVGDSLLALHLFEPTSEWAGKSRVHLVFENLRDELDARIQDYLEQHRLDETYAPIVVPFSPGGTTDMLARALSEQLGGTLGAPTLVEHTPINRKSVAAQHETTAQLGDDVLTIMTNSGALAAALSAKKKQTRLAPVTLLAESEMVLAVSGASPWRDAGALARAAKSAGKRRLRYASVGPASVSHLCAALFARAGGFELDHVPYPGAQPAVRALIDGEVDLYFGTPPTFLPHIRAGSVRALATTGSRRSEIFPDLPRMADYYPGFDVSGWQGVFAPASASSASIARLRRRVVKAMNAPQLRKRLARQGFRVALSTPKELEERIARELADWREKLADSGIALDTD